MVPAAAWVCSTAEACSLLEERQHKHGCTRQAAVVAAAAGLTLARLDGGLHIGHGGRGREVQHMRAVCGGGAAGISIEAACGAAGAAGKRLRSPTAAAAGPGAAMRAARAARPCSPVRTNTIFTGALSTNVPSSSTVKEAGGGRRGGHEGRSRRSCSRPQHDSRRTRSGRPSAPYRIRSSRSCRLVAPPGRERLPTSLYSAHQQPEPLPVDPPCRPPTGCSP